MQRARKVALETCGMSLGLHHPPLLLPLLQTLRTVFQSEVSIGKAGYSSMDAQIVKVIQQVLHPSMRWAPGKVGGAVRCASLSSLRHAFQLLHEESLKELLRPVQGARSEGLENSARATSTDTSVRRTPTCGDLPRVLLDCLEGEFSEVRLEALKAMEVLGSRVGTFVSDNIREVRTRQQGGHDNNGQSAEAGAIAALLKRLDDQDVRVRTCACCTIGAFLGYAGIHATENRSRRRLDAASSEYLIRGLLLHVDDDCTAVRGAALRALEIAGQCHSESLTHEFREAESSLSRSTAHLLRQLPVLSA
eukprot:scaffold14_cov380-Prasinococcus_capsulatus_cf.AAC.3